MGNYHENQEARKRAGEIVELASSAPVRAGDEVLHWLGEGVAVRDDRYGACGYDVGGMWLPHYPDDTTRCDERVMRLFCRPAAVCGRNTNSPFSS